MPGYFLIALLSLAVCAVAILMIVDRKRKLFHLGFHRDEGRFLVKGKKKNFKIKKDDRFEFTVVNGQIVSVKDKRVSARPVKYGGIENG